SLRRTRDSTQDRNSEIDGGAPSGWGPSPLFGGRDLTLTRPLIAKLCVPLVAFAATLGAILLLNRSTAPSGSGMSGGGAFAAPGASTDAQIAALERDVAANQSNTQLYAALGNEFLQKVRETGDAAFYARAETAFRQGLRRDPHDAGTLTGMAALAL